jgi:hypothetical protein
VLQYAAARRDEPVDQYGRRVTASHGDGKKMFRMMAK